MSGGSAIVMKTKWSCSVKVYLSKTGKWFLYGYLMGSE